MRFPALLAALILTIVLAAGWTTRSVVPEPPSAAAAPIQPGQTWQVVRKDATRRAVRFWVALDRHAPYPNGTGWDLYGRGGMVSYQPRTRLVTVSTFDLFDPEAGPVLGPVNVCVALLEGRRVHGFLISATGSRGLNRQLGSVSEPGSLAIPTT
jgi:hypothetical protein